MALSCYLVVGLPVPPLISNVGIVIQKTCGRHCGVNEFADVFPFVRLDKSLVATVVQLIQRQHGVFCRRHKSVFTVGLRLVEDSLKIRLQDLAALLGVFYGVMAGGVVNHLANDLVLQVEQLFGDIDGTGPLLRLHGFSSNAVVPQVDRREVREAVQRPRALGGEEVAPKVERGEISQTGQRPRAIVADAIFPEIERDEVDQPRKRPRAFRTDVVPIQIEGRQIDEAGEGLSAFGADLVPAQIERRQIDETGESLRPFGGDPGAPQTQRGEVNAPGQRSRALEADAVSSEVERFESGQMSQGVDANRANFVLSEVKNSEIGDGRQNSWRLRRRSRCAQDQARRGAVDWPAPARPRRQCDSTQD